MSVGEPVITSPAPGEAVLRGHGLSAASLLAANAGLLVVFFAFDLTLFQLVFVYWVECVWIGLFSALKLLVASLVGDPYENRLVGFSRGGAFFLSIVLIAFASSWFFGTVAVGGFALLMVFENLAPDAADRFAIESIGLALGASLLFLASHGLSFVINFLAGREFASARVVPLVLLPFKRCLALFVIIGLAFAAAKLVPGLASATGFAVAAIAFKLVWDYRLHRAERDSFAGGGV